MIAPRAGWLTRQVVVVWQTETSPMDGPPADDGEVNPTDTAIMAEKMRRAQNTHISMCPDCAVRDDRRYEGVRVKRRVTRDTAARFFFVPKNFPRKCGAQPPNYEPVYTGKRITREVTAALAEKKSLPSIFDKYDLLCESCLWMRRIDASLLHCKPCGETKPGTDFTTRKSPKDEWVIQVDPSRCKKCRKIKSARGKKNKKITNREGERREKALAALIPQVCRLCNQLFTRDLCHRLYPDNCEDCFYNTKNKSWRGGKNGPKDWAPEGGTSQPPDSLSLPDRAEGDAESVSPALLPETPPPPPQSPAATPKRQASPATAAGDDVNSNFVTLLESQDWDSTKDKANRAFPLPAPPPSPVPEPSKKAKAPLQPDPPAPKRPRITPVVPVPPKAVDAVPPRAPMVVPAKSKPPHPRTEDEEPTQQRKFQRAVAARSIPVQTQPSVPEVTILQVGNRGMPVKTTTFQMTEKLKELAKTRRITANGRHWFIRADGDADSAQEWADVIAYAETGVTPAGNSLNSPYFVRFSNKVASLGLGPKTL